MNTKQLTLRIPENVYGALREKQQGLSFNQLMLQILWRFVKNQPLKR